MAPQSRRKIARIIDKLFAEPYRFTFFQAVRLLQTVARPKNIKDKDFGPVGYDVTPEREAVHFSSSPRLSYPGVEIGAIRENVSGKPATTLPPDMTVNFLGLTGPKGVLPVHYTELQQHRMREKDLALNDFFNLINHRTISLFYRAWQKYKLPMLYELHHKYPALGATDSITEVLHALLGNADEAVRKSLPIGAEQMLYYAGQFCSSRRSGPSLDLLLRECFKIPVVTRQFQGEWVDLVSDDRTQLSLRGKRVGKNNILGRNVILGKRAYVIDGKFQLVLGPLSKPQFDAIKPGSERFNALCRFTRTFAGMEVLFNLRLKVSAEAISRMVIGRRQASPPRLGWDTWLLAKDKFPGDGQGGMIEEIVVPATRLG